MADLEKKSLDSFSVFVDLEGCPIPPDQLAAVSALYFVRQEQSGKQSCSFGRLLLHVLASTFLFTLFLFLAITEIWAGYGSVLDISPNSPIEGIICTENGEKVTCPSDIHTFVVLDRDNLESKNGWLGAAVLLPRSLNVGGCRPMEKPTDDHDHPRAIGVVCGFSGHGFNETLDEPAILQPLSLSAGGYADEIVHHNRPASTWCPSWLCPERQDGAAPITCVEDRVTVVCPHGMFTYVSLNRPKRPDGNPLGWLGAAVFMPQALGVGDCNTWPNPPGDIDDPENHPKAVGVICDYTGKGFRDSEQQQTSCSQALDFQVKMDESAERLGKVGPDEENHLIHGSPAHQAWFHRVQSPFSVSHSTVVKFDDIMEPSKPSSMPSVYANLNFSSKFSVVHASNFTSPHLHYNAPSSSQAINSPWSGPRIAALPGEKFDLYSMQLGCEYPSACNITLTSCMSSEEGECNELETVLVNGIGKADAVTSPQWWRKVTFGTMGWKNIGAVVFQAVDDNGHETGVLIDDLEVFVQRGGKPIDDK